MSTPDGGPPDKTQTLDKNNFKSTADWDAVVSELYKAGYVYGFTVDNWVTFTGYAS